MSTVDQVQRTVMERMLRGELAPGTWMRQDELAEQLGVSKIPVREALQRLAAIGLLRFESNRGAVVPALSANEAEESFALRQAIEPLLLRRAIPRLSIVDLSAAEINLKREDLSLTAANWAFHQALYQASKWQRGLAMAEVLHAAVAPYVLLYTRDLGGAEDSDAEHMGILAACRESDSDAACSLLAGHLRRAAAALLEFLRRSES